MKAYNSTEMQLTEKYSKMPHDFIFESVRNKKWLYLQSATRCVFFALCTSFKDADFDNLQELYKKRTDCINLIRSQKEALQVGLYLFFCKNRYVHLEVVDYKETIVHLVYDVTRDEIAFIKGV